MCSCLLCMLQPLQPLGFQPLGISSAHCHCSSHGCPVQDGHEGHQGQDQCQAAHEGHHQGHQDHEEDQGHEGHEGSEGHEGHKGHKGHQGPRAAIAANTATALDGHHMQCQGLPILAVGVQAIHIWQLHPLWPGMGQELAHHQAQDVGPCMQAWTSPMWPLFQAPNFSSSHLKRKKMVGVSFGL